MDGESKKGVYYFKTSDQIRGGNGKRCVRIMVFEAGRFRLCRTAEND
jgi:hypothetical protein